MHHDNITSNSNITREQLIQLLNKDLAFEYEAVIAIIVYSQVLKRASYPAIVRQLELHAAEDYEHLTQIAKQIHYLGGNPCVGLNTTNAPTEPVALLVSNINRNREHSIDLASLVGLGVAHPNCLAPENATKPRHARGRPKSPKLGVASQQSVRRSTAKPRAGNGRALRVLQPA